MLKTLNIRIILPFCISADYQMAISVEVKRAVLFDSTDLCICPINRFHNQYLLYAEYLVILNGPNWYFACLKINNICDSYFPLLRGFNRLLK